MQFPEIVFLNQSTAHIEPHATIGTPHDAFVAHCPNVHSTHGLVAAISDYFDAPPAPPGPKPRCRAGTYPDEVESFSSPVPRLQQKYADLQQLQEQEWAVRQLVLQMESNYLQAALFSMPPFRHLVTRPWSGHRPRSGQVRPQSGHGRPRSGHRPPASVDRSAKNPKKRPQPVLPPFLRHMDRPPSAQVRGVGLRAVARRVNGGY